MNVGTDVVGIAVVYLCHDGNGNVVLNLRGEKCRDEHHRWDCGGGAVDVGVSVEETLTKEINEEYGTHVVNAEFLGYRNIFREHNGKVTHWVTLDFFVRVDPSYVKNGEPHKFDDVAWFPLTALPSPLHSQFPWFLEKYASKIRNEDAVLV